MQRCARISLQANEQGNCPGNILSTQDDIILPRGRTPCLARMHDIYQFDLLVAGGQGIDRDVKKGP